MAKKMIYGSKKTAADIAFEVIAYTIFSLLILFFSYPFYYLLINTISDNQLVSINKVVLYPIGVHFENYVKIFQLKKLPQAAFISLARTVIGVVGHVLLSAYAGYIFSKTEMWRRKFWYRLVISVMYFNAGLIPVYLHVKNLGLMNSFWVYIVMHIWSTYHMILIKTYIESLPSSLEEAAEIDGAGYLSRFVRIVLPLSKPILATIGLFSAVSHWNNMWDTKMYITSPKLYTLQFVLYEYLEHIKSLEATMMENGASADLLAKLSSSRATSLTLTAVTVIPIMCVYPYLQKHYVKGIMVGAVKG